MFCFTCLDSNCKQQSSLSSDHAKELDIEDEFPKYKELKSVVIDHAKKSGSFDAD